MAGIAADRLARLLERLDLGVDGEHLLDEGAAEMEQPHLERAFVLGTQGGSAFREELPHVGLEPDAFGRLPAAGGAGLDEHAVADLAGPGESLGVFEAVVAAEAADGLALLLDECQRRMLLDRLAELLQLAVDPLLAQGRVERGRVEEDVDVFRESLDQAPALGQAGAALENDLGAGRLLDDAQGLRDVIILLDDRLAQAARAEMVRRADDGLLEVRMLNKLRQAIPLDSARGRNCRPPCVDYFIDSVYFYCIPGVDRTQLVL